MTQPPTSNGRRARWSVIGAAIAIALAAGTVGLVGATVDEGERPVLVQIEPCRLADTRPTSTVGTRSTPIGHAEEYNVVAHGMQGNCDIPAEAVGLSLNVTAAQATTLTNLRIYPGDAMTPLAASLNPAPGTGPVPNAVTTGLDEGGSFNVYNEFGTVHVIIDVNGYYEDHNHDDRYAGGAAAIDEIVMTSSGSAWDYDGPSEVIGRSGGFTWLPGNGMAFNALSGPTFIDGREFKISSVRTCWFYYDHPHAVIDEVNLMFSTDPPIGGGVVLSRGDYSTDGCATFAVPDYGWGDDMTGLALELWLSGGVGTSVRLTGVESTWVAADN